MKRIVLPCYSPNPDRRHDFIVMQFGDNYPATLGYYGRAFDATRLQIPELYSMEISNPAVQLFSVATKDGDDLDNPGDLEYWPEYVIDSGYEESELKLTELEAQGIYLVVTENRFHLTWDGSEKHAPAEIYESESFPLGAITSYRWPS